MGWPAHKPQITVPKPQITVPALLFSSVSDLLFQFTRFYADGHGLMAKNGLISNCARLCYMLMGQLFCVIITRFDAEVH